MFRRSFSFAWLLFAIPAMSTAETRNWTGATSSDWFTPSNWDTAAVPVAGDHVYIDTTTPNIATINNDAGTISLLRIGNNNHTGQLTLTAGAALIVSGAIDLGLSGGSGTLSIAGGSVKTSNKLSVGASGASGSGTSGMGALSVTQGGILNTAGASFHGVGNLGTSGTATVSGAGSQWSSSRMIVIGPSGDGSLNITEGGSVKITAAHQEFIIADHADATGIVVIDGTDASLALASGIVVGNEGFGEIHVLNGGRIDSASGSINPYGGVIGGLSSNLGGIGVVTIEGSGSHWENNADLYVGATGSGTLNILDGGAATSTGQASIGGTAGYPSQATVNGSGSTWTAGTSLNVADGADATLLITNGGKVVSQSGTIGNDQDGTVILRGADSLWDITTGLTIGSANGHGTLILGAPEDQAAVAAGQLDAASLMLTATGTLLLNHTDDSGTYILPTPLSGEGTVTIVAGTTTLSSDSSAFTGTTTITGGRLIVDQALGGTVNIDAGGTLSGTGTIHGPMASAGILDPEPSTPDETFATLTINGDFDGGTVHLDTALGDSASPSDQLIVLGDTSGNADVEITNTGGNGAATTGDGILVIQVEGASDGTFSLTTPLTVGGFTYTLKKGDDGNWYLQSSGTASAATAIPVNLPAALLLLIIALMGTAFAILRKRYR